MKEALARLCGVRAELLVVYDVYQDAFHKRCEDD
jgi:hypothetical protein